MLATNVRAPTTYIHKHMCADTHPNMCIQCENYTGSRPIWRRKRRSKAIQLRYRVSAHLLQHI